MIATNGVSWEGLLSSVRAGHPELFRSWFDELEPGTLESGELRVTVRDPAQARFLSENCGQAFIDAAMEQTGHLVTVRFLCPQPQQPLATSNRPGLTPMALSPDYTFEQFVVGPSNRMAHAACRAVCSQPGQLYNPLFLHGRSGLGKTHLLQAVCSELLRAPAAMDVLYVSCESFVNDFVRAIQTGELPNFRDSVRRADFLLIDDIQFLANRESSQEELFHTFNAIYQSRRQIILSADSPPSEIPTLEDRLVSRFNWGLVTQIDPPTRETRHAILQKKARLRGVEVPDEVLDFVAEQVQSNIRVLEGALTKLISESQLGGKPLNLDTAREVLTDLDGATVRQLQVPDILDAISKHFSVRLPELIGRKRSRSLSYPRQLGMYLARKLTPLSLEEIGGYFGGRDHSTVLHAERVIEADRRHDSETAETLSLLTRQLLARR